MLCPRTLLLLPASLLIAGCAASPPVAAAPAPAVPICARPDLQAVEKANHGDSLLKIDVDGASAAYEEAAVLDPQNHRILFKLALAHRKAERWEAMEPVLARAVELAPGYANYWMERGYALEMRARRGQIPWQGAREALERCAALDPNLAPCHAELGNALLQLDDERGALASYTRAVEHDPPNIAYYTLLAGLYLDVGRTDDAEKVLKAAAPFLAARPAPPGGDKAIYNLHLLAAKARSEHGDVDATVRELEAARAVAPPDGVESLLILWNLGSTYATLSPPRKPEAITLLKAFVSRACKSSKAALYRAECEQSLALVSRLGGSL